MQSMLDRKGICDTEIQMEICTNGMIMSFQEYTCIGILDESTGDSSYFHRGRIG